MWEVPGIRKMAGIHRYFKPIAGLPRTSEMNIGESATTIANTDVQNVLEM